MPEEKIKTKPNLDEIATTSKDIDIFGGWLNRLENPDPTLRIEAHGKGLKLYDEVDRDPHAGSVLQTRYLAVIGKDWEILPAEESGKKGQAETETRAQAIASFVQETLKNTNLSQFIQELLQAILFGFYVAEIMWKVKGGKIVPGKVRAKHPRRFSFTMDRELRLLTPADMVEGEPVPDRKFIRFTYGSSDNPYGKGLGQKLWWPVWFKKNGIKFWLVFLEKFGMPTGVGKYPSGASKEQQDKLLEAIDALQNETGVKIPDNVQIELLEATRSGKVTYETLCDYMDRQISKAVLGQTLTTEVKGEGSYAASQTHNEVREDILEADVDLLCECLNETLIPWIVDFNFANVTAYPKFFIRVKEMESQKDLAERDKIVLKDIGAVDVPKRYFYEKYGYPEPEEGEDVYSANSQGNPPQPGSESDDFSEGDNTEAALTDRLEDESGAMMDGLIGPVRDLLENAIESGQGLEEFRENLISLYSDMDVAELGTLMQRALTAAELLGRYEVAEQK